MISFKPFKRPFTLNLNGARDVKKRLKHIDVMFVQETHSESRNQVDWNREWAGQVILSHGSSTSAGVGVLFSSACLPVSVTTEEVIPGRLLVVQAVFEKYKVVLINVYAPTTGAERLAFLRETNDVLNNCSSESYLFLGGNFNCTENATVDRNHLEPRSASSRLLKQVTETHELVDVWRNLNSKDRQYTWSHARDNIMSLARLDRFYTFKHHLSAFKACFIRPVAFTDHAMVLCHVFIPDQT